MNYKYVAVTFILGLVIGVVGWQVAEQSSTSEETSEKPTFSTQSVSLNEKSRDGETDVKENDLGDKTQDSDTFKDTGDEGIKEVFYECPKVNYENNGNFRFVRNGGSYNNQVRFTIGTGSRYANTPTLDDLGYGSSLDGMCLGGNCYYNIRNYHLVDLLRCDLEHNAGGNGDWSRYEHGFQKNFSTPRECRGVWDQNPKGFYCKVDTQAEDPVRM